jgi:membrane dipeptidase
MQPVPPLPPLPPLPAMPGAVPVRAASAMASTRSLERALDVLADHPVLDGHNDLPYALRTLSFYDLEATDPCEPLAGTHTDLPRLRAGRVGGQFWSVYVPTSLAGERAVTATLEQIDVVRRLATARPEAFALCATADDAAAALAGGRVASLLGMEGGHSIDCSLGALRQMYELGARYLTLTHNDNVPWADSATDAVGCGGLTEFGVEVVREMNRLGMLVDLSHVSVATMHAALDASRAPVIFSHSSCRALVDHPRNVPDEVLTRLGGNGGVLMVTFVPAFVSQRCADWEGEVKAEMVRRGLRPSDWEAQTAVAAEYASARPRPFATLGQVADHLDHARSVIGAAYLGLGGDYDGVDVLPVGLEDVAAYPLLFAELVERGWSDDELAGLACRNVLRALRQAEVTAAALRLTERPSTLRFS